MNTLSQDTIRQRIGLPLEAKVILSQQRIRQWYDHWHGQVYVSFSGGLDSTVLLHLTRAILPRVPGVFLDTGMEYPEIYHFVKTKKNVDWIKPKMNFKQVINQYGYPVVSKEQAQYIREVRNGVTDYMRKKRLLGINGSRSGMISYKWQYLIDSPFKIDSRCCDIMKKRPANAYQKETGRYPIIGIRASESSLRKQRYARQGCNAFDSKHPKSSPLSFWSNQDIWDYINLNDLEYSKIYDMGEKRTGCMFCMFGVHLEPEPNRFQRMKKTHPYQWDYCINKLGCGNVLSYIGVPYGSE